MSPSFPFRVTIAVSAELIEDANALALVIGTAPGDVQTFGDLWAQDGDGGVYAVACTHAGPTFPETAGSPLVAPPHSPDADLTAAGRAQAALAIGTPDAPPVPATGRIAALLAPNDSPDPMPAHLALMGLTLRGKP
jgi:hypothetical protein